jgi:hypothetical protein
MEEQERLNVRNGTSALPDAARLIFEGNLKGAWQ